ncbi:MAG: Galactose-1-phosphate uridylyltransferase [Parcubacteria group bacterium GW2011_GWA2_47_26]|nr:MAG: Galactose-1-phosphate uridylyltransferase [Parcubacteria group bacterium GW2011_GWA2_47_26]
MSRSELRKDYIQDKYVIIAPRRGKRPQKMETGPKTTIPPCRLCPGQIDKEPFLLEVWGKKEWLIKVVANKFPAVSLDNSKAYGTQEVVIETPEHGKHLEELSDDQVAKLFWVYAGRTKTISENKKIEYILIFKNSGGPAGASLQHAHSQIFATHFLPPNLFDKSQKVQSYKLRTGRCVYCDVLQKEKRGARFIWDDNNVIAFAPYASLHNYEVWILPKRHLDNITNLTEAERFSWAKILRHVLKKIVALNLPYNFYFHQVIHDEDQHLYMKITPRGSVWAGVEIGSGLIINPVSPEEAAEYYRE